VPIFSQRDEVRRYFDDHLDENPVESWYIWQSFPRPEKEEWGIEGQGPIPFVVDNMPIPCPREKKQIVVSRRHARRPGVREGLWRKLVAFAKHREQPRLVLRALMED
jgi:hypothetical protein